MPPANDPSSGSLTGPPLWTLTAVVIAVSGVLFFFVSEPLASAFDLLMPSSRLAPDADAEELPAAEPEEPEQPAEPPPRIWTPAEIEAGMAELGESLIALVAAGTAELPTYEELGTADAPGAQRAAARWARWGVVWHNRVGAERAKMPPREQCLPPEDLRAACTEVHDILDRLAAVSEAETYDDASARMNAAAERQDLYLNPPTPIENTDDASLDVAEPTQ